MHSARPSTTQAILASATLLALGVMACPNTPWDSGDPVRELERMHARVSPEPVSVPFSRVSLNLLVRSADGSPAPGVSVRVREPGDQAAGTALVAMPSRVFFEGVTGTDGRCLATIRLPATLREFAVEWSAARSAQETGIPPQEAWQPMARTLVKRRELAALELSLARP